MQLTAAFRFTNNVTGNAVLDAAAWIQEFGFRVNVTTGFIADASQSDQWRIADGVQDVRGHQTRWCLARTVNKIRFGQTANGPDSTGTWSPLWFAEPAGPIRSCRD